LHLVSWLVPHLPQAIPNRHFWHNVGAYVSEGATFVVKCGRTGGGGGGGGGASGASFAEGSRGGYATTYSAAPAGSYGSSAATATPYSDI
jgi:hypothetical protein